MRIMEEPYFLINDDFWFYDKDEGIFRLTEEGLKNKRAKESYDKFYKNLEEGEHERD